MALSYVTLGVAALAGHAVAFPAMPNLIGRTDTKKAKRVNGVLVGFDPETQYVDVSGVHQFVPPGHGDLRGPCPGLNSLANHNYLPHDGVATIQEFIDATNKVFGMGLDLGTFLAIYGAVADGDLTSWSIGGAPPPENIIDLLSQPQGISGSHNKYEGDASPTRGDLYSDGNSADVKLENWRNLYAKQAGVSNDESNYDLDIITDFKAERRQQSLEQNPYFFNAPFSGVVALPAAYSFIFRFMANKSSEHPEGQLTKNVLKSFYAMYGDDDDNLEYKVGWEQIPENWYTRAIGDEYTIPFLVADAAAAALQYPEFLAVGGNTGKVNSFAGVDPSDLTGSVYNLKNLLEGNNLICFGIEGAIQFLPDFIQSFFRDVTGAVAKASDAASDALAGLNCPAVEGWNKNLFGPFPGWTKLNADGQYED